MSEETPLLADLNLGDALVAVETSGAAFLSRVLTPTFCRRLQAQLEGAPFEKLPDQIGPVRQEADLFVTRGAMTDLPAVATLRDDLVGRLRHHATASSDVADWWPNEAYVQRYARGSLGVSAHVDSSRFAILVAVFTTHGSARFAVCRDRSGDTFAEWVAGPGSLLLLRGSARAQPGDRPFHEVRGPSGGPRFSVTLRMNTRYLVNSRTFE
jgi:hypothetical protein